MINILLHPNLIIQLKKNCWKIKIRKPDKQKWYCWFRKEEIFFKKLIKVTSNKKRKVKPEMKRSDHVTCCTKLINDLSGEVKLIPTKELTKDLRNVYGILNGAKCFVDNGSENCLVFQSVFQYFETFTSANKFFTRKSGRLSEDIFKVPVTSDNSFVL